MSGPRNLLLVSATLGAAFLTGCGSDTSRAPGEQNKAFRVVYDLSKGGEGDYDQIEVLTDGGAKIRVTIRKEGKALSTSVFTDAGSGSTAKDDWPRFVVSETDGTLAAWCVDAKLVGTAQVLARDVRHYRCRNFGMGLLLQASELWVDEQSALVLKWAPSGGAPITASKVDFSATVPVGAFTTQPAATSG